MENLRCVLGINAIRVARVDEIIDFFNDLQNAYENIYALELKIRDVKLSSKKNLNYYEGKRKLPELKPVYKVRQVVLPNDRLVLYRAKIGSPGIWEFLASLNPLEQIRRYLCDRHERRKDKEWREDEESRKMRLDNLLIETAVIRERIEIFKKLGISDEQIRRIILVNLHEPLSKLDVYQDNDLIGSAYITNFENLNEKRKKFMEKKGQIEE